MKELFILFMALVCLTPNSFSGENDVLFTVDEEPVLVEDFEYIYNKNNFNNKADYTEESLREYLELYINFRLKVKEAEALGLDEDAKLQSELKVYQEQLYNSFFDREKLKALVDEHFKILNAPAKGTKSELNIESTCCPGVHDSKSSVNNTIK